MRQGNPNNKQQQQQRMRGRSGNNGGGGNTNRKGPSPLNRSYESTGPDVKIRGTALHIAEKYVQLARDAQSSGDRVLAESYLQHAEHYYRIIAAAQAQLQQPITVIRSDIQSDEDDDDDLDTAADARSGSGFVTADAPQPFLDDGSNEMPEQVARSNGDRTANDRSSNDRQLSDRPQRDRFGRDRGDRGERFSQDRGDRGENDRGGDRNRMTNNGQRGYRGGNGGNDYRPNGMRNGEGRGDMNQGEGNRAEQAPGEPMRGDAGRLENRVEGRPEYRSDRADRFGNRGERPMRERPQYRSDRGERSERPERSERFESERREPRVEAFEAPEERVVEPVIKNELPAFITGIQPRSEAKTERPARVERSEEVAAKPVAAPVAAAPAPVTSAPVAEAAGETPVVPVKRPRGRPRKIPIEVVAAPVVDE